MICRTCFPPSKFFQQRMKHSISFSNYQQNPRRINIKSTTSLYATRGYAVEKDGHISRYEIMYVYSKLSLIIYTLLQIITNNLTFSPIGERQVVQKWILFLEMPTLRLKSSLLKTP